MTRGVAMGKSHRVYDAESEREAVRTASEPGVKDRSAEEKVN